MNENPEPYEKPQAVEIETAAGPISTAPLSLPTAA
jgi:hypothetical protein